MTLFRHHFILGRPSANSTSVAVHRSENASLQTRQTCAFGKCFEMKSKWHLCKVDNRLRNGSEAIVFGIRKQFALMISPPFCFDCLWCRYFGRWTTGLGNPLQYVIASF
jgi:hypothetical protein